MQIYTFKLLFKINFKKNSGIFYPLFSIKINVNYLLVIQFFHSFPNTYLKYWYAKIKATDRIANDSFK
ncbi:hypothetical protein ACVWYG_003704 [Pedobacter sp. UYEF25]